MAFNQWIILFDTMIELLALQQTRSASGEVSLTDHAKNLLLFSHLGVRGGKIVANSAVYAEIATKTHTALSRKL